MAFSLLSEITAYYDVLLSEMTKTFRSVSLTLHCEMFSDILNIY